MQALRRAQNCAAQVGASRERGVDEVRDHLGVGVGIEAVARGFQFGAQLGVVLDDAVVHHRDALVRHVRVRVDRVRHAVRGPARVRDAGAAGDRLRFVQRFELAHLALGAHAREAPVLEHRDTGRIVAAVLECLEAGDQHRNDIATGDGSNDSAHGQAVHAGAVARAPAGSD